MNNRTDCNSTSFIVRFRSVEKTSLQSDFIKPYETHESYLPRTPIAALMINPDAIIQDKWAIQTLIQSPKNSSTYLQTFFVSCTTNGSLSS